MGSRIGLGGGSVGAGAAGSCVLEAACRALGLDRRFWSWRTVSCKEKTAIETLHKAQALTAGRSDLWLYCPL